ncbi:MAG: hypothetical protein ACRENA_08690 [Vulcanimicrobiaceae bacterium]
MSPIGQFGAVMEFKAYLAEIDSAIREHDRTNEFSLAYADSSYNSTYDGEPIWMRGKLGARVLKGATPVQSIIQWLDGPKIDHMSKAIVGEHTSKDAAMEIMLRLRRGF